MPKSDKLQTVVVVDDDRAVGDGVALGISRQGRRVIVCRDIECAKLVIENEPVDAIVADIQFRGAFSFDGLDFVTTLKKEHPETPVFLMTGVAHDELEREALARGAAGFFRKPFSVADLDARLVRPEGQAEESQIQVPEIDDLIDASLIDTRFQPIVRISDRHSEGVEALARPTTESLFRSPELLFRYASRTERTVDLERYCLVHAIHLASGKLPDGVRLFMNVHPTSLEGPAIVNVMERSLQQTGFDPTRIVLEITEQGSIHSRKSLDQIVALKATGIQFALDDIGIAFSHLPFIDEIAPAWMKISQYFGTDFEKDPTRSKIVRNVAALATSFDARFILEGIETEDTAKAALDLGIEYGQGYLFARPEQLELLQL